MRRSAVRSAHTRCGHHTCASPLRSSHSSSGKLIMPLLCSLTNCGHTFCQGCLIDWFGTILRQHHQNGARGPPGYTCPSCRHAVRTPPVQNFSLKRIARIAAESRGESSPRRPPPPLPSVPLPRGRGCPRKDFPPGPFDDYFRGWR